MPLKFSPKTKRNLIKIIPFGVVWGGAAILYSIIEYGILGDSDIYPSTNNIYRPLNSIFINAPGAIAIGLLVGMVEITFLKDLFNGIMFWNKILFKSIFYVLTISLFLILTSLIVNSSGMGLSLLDSKVLQSTKQFIGNFVFLSIVVYCGFMAMLSLFIAEVSNYLGDTIFNNFFIGKYHQPIEERRIFMFLDMKASTSIAEELGHIQYFKLLNQYYDIMAKDIIQYKGEVYQYIGDEVVITWEYERGANAGNCIQCYFALKENIHQQAAKFEKHFGIAPDFKAGIHVGEVTTGEIGSLKKEIVFTGDVLNTTARIQGLCANYRCDLIVSEKLMEVISDTSNNYEFKFLGQILLRGKKKLVSLYSVIK